MSKLEELIARLCPDGVEYKSLGDLGKFYGGITGKSKEDFKDGNEKFITYMNVYSNIALKIDVNDSVRIMPNEKQRTLEYGDVIFTGSSETPDECGISSVLTTKTDQKLYLNSFCFFFRFDNKNLILPDFSKYVFRSSYLRYQIGKTASGVTRFNVSKKLMEKVKIPVPPLEVQREIVHILDFFSLLTAELAAELAARQKQYEFYRDELVSCPSNTVIVKLSDIAYFYNGDRGKNYPKISEMVSDGIPFVNAGDVNGKVDTINCNKITREKYNSLGGAKLKKNDILYCLRGSTGKNGIYNKEEGTVASSLVAIRVDSSKADFKYIYYLLNSKLEIKQRLKADTGAAQPNLSAQNVKNYEFPLPPLSEQQRIVDILDRFDALCNDITSGLPAEIEARKKQYEYYRDKLLTFKELKKEA